MTDEPTSSESAEGAELTPESASVVGAGTVMDPMPSPATRLRSTDWKYWGPVATAIVLLVGLRFVISGYDIYLADTVGLAAMGAMALSLLTGFAGQVSLGNAAFIGSGAFIAQVASSHGLSFVVSVLLAAIACGVLGALVGAPAVRVRGLYLLLSTLALFYIFNFVTEQYQSGTAGSGGFTLPETKLFGTALVTPSQWYWVIAVVAFLTWFALRNLVLSRRGRAWTALRYNESVARGMGLPVSRLKLSAFIISSIICGFQGGLTAYFVGTITADQWTVTLAISYVAMITIGGLGSITGAIWGAAIITLLPSWINDLVTGSGLPSAIVNNVGPVTSCVYGLLLVGVVAFAPGGIAQVLSRLWALVRRGVSR